MTAMDDFAVAIKRAVPKGSSFRGFPIAFNHVSPSRVWDSLMASTSAREIIDVRLNAMSREHAQSCIYILCFV